MVRNSKNFSPLLFFPFLEPLRTNQLAVTVNFSPIPDNTCGGGATLLHRALYKSSPHSQLPIKCFYSVNFKIHNIEKSK